MRHGGSGIQSMKIISGFIEHPSSSMAIEAHFERMIEIEKKRKKWIDKTQKIIYHSDGSTDSAEERQ